MDSCESLRVGPHAVSLPRGVPLRRSGQGCHRERTGSDPIEQRRPHRLLRGGAQGLQVAARRPDALVEPGPQLVEIPHGGGRRNSTRRTRRYRKRRHQHRPTDRHRDRRRHSRHLRHREQRLPARLSTRRHRCEPRLPRRRRPRRSHTGPAPAFQWTARCISDVPEGHRAVQLMNQALLKTICVDKDNEARVG